MTEQFANNAESTLVAVMTATSSVASLANATIFPHKPTFKIVIDFEIMLVTAINGNDLTVIRGAEGTTAAPHTVGASVINIITKGSFDSYRTETILESNIGSNVIPDNTLDPLPGRIVFNLRGYSLWKDRGSPGGFGRYGPLYPLGTYINSSNLRFSSTFGIGRQGQASSDLNSEGFIVSNNFTTSSSIVVLSQPATTATILALFYPQIGASWSMGICLFDPVKGTVISFGFNNQKQLTVDQWNSLGGVAQNYFTLDFSSYYFSQPIWLAIGNNSPNPTTFSYGFDPFTLNLVHSRLYNLVNVPNIMSEIGVYQTGNGAVRLLSYV